MKSTKADGKDGEKEKTSAAMFVKLVSCSSGLVACFIPVTVLVSLSPPLLSLSQFKYATYLDVFLIVTSLLFAICHGSALPIAMYVFGDLTNLFANYDITLLVFENTTGQFPLFFGNYTFLDGPSNVTTIEEAVNQMTVDPLLLETRTISYSFSSLPMNVFGSM